MEQLLNSISADTIIQISSLFIATITFIIAQRIEKRRDRKEANREVYQNLELASIDLFRFEAENIELIRPIWEKNGVVPEKGTAEYIVTMNYICQILNLFEIAIKFRKDKIMPPDIFGSWVAWFHLLVMSPGPAFNQIWEDSKWDYIPDLREIINAGLRIKEDYSLEEQRESLFYLFVSKVFKCNIIKDWTTENEDSPYDDFWKDSPSTKGREDSPSTKGREDRNNVE